MKTGVIWPTTRGKWNVGIYQPIEFHTDVQHDAEWDSDYDASRFLAGRTRVSRAEAEKLLVDHEVQQYEVLSLHSPKIPGLNRIAKEYALRAI